ncbi:uncharacterized protein LOC121390107 [Gigantopelta aegis]|uniref:uncharacterized protein LOC121390107 n=1 Tax=Gigantopelta aegis TaxID=1735272 RepID=UPI001B88C768|nr:uncharacterized protein LOC121390107 [Gigantopelta aegis]
MRLILVLFCLVLAIGLAAAARGCHKGSKYDDKARKCICQSGYYGKTCKYQCKFNGFQFATYMWNTACKKSYVRSNCQKSCEACSGAKCKDRAHKDCHRTMRFIMDNTRRLLCYRAKENCPTICHTKGKRNENSFQELMENQPRELVDFN